MSKTKIIIADVFDGLAKIADDSVDCCVTSPPYWMLRDYGVDGQIGMEATMQDHLDVMSRVFAEVRRVLKPEGTCWINYGDCYATTPNGRSAAAQKAAGTDDRTFRDKPGSTIGGVLKPKDLVMMPNRLAIRLQEDGWWIRSEIIWAKPSPMPESVRDRPATSHEKIFMLTKSGRYFYDTAAVRQNAKESSVARWSQNVEDQEGSHRANGGAKTNGPMKAVGGPKGDKQRGHSRRHAGFNDRWGHMSKEEQQENGRHLRNWEPAPAQVWEMCTAAFKGAHFATFPPELVERCLKAGCPVGGLVLDPFGGSGTTAMVANQMGMDAVIIELNPEYGKIAWHRITKESPLLSDIAVESQIPLFPIDT